MAEVIRMPLLSDTMKEGKIAAWLKKVGDVVKSDDVLAEVETDKATMEVMGYVDGTLLHIGVPAGSSAKIDEIICIVLIKILLTLNLLHFLIFRLKLEK